VNRSDILNEIVLNKLHRSPNTTIREEDLKAQEISHRTNHIKHTGGISHSKGHRILGTKVHIRKEGILMTIPVGQDRDQPAEVHSKEGDRVH